MYLISCPQGHSFSVSTSAAGSEVPCPTCGQNTSVPKLGELRRLPRADEGNPTRSSKSQSSMGARTVFAICALGAIAAGITAAYASIRCYALPAPISSEFHIEQDRKQISELNPLDLLMVWEEYEKMDFESQFPFPYKRIQDMRDEWTGVAMTSLVVAAVLAGIGTLTIVVGRRKSESLDT